MTIAKAINGPWHQLPVRKPGETGPTLDELRDIRWKMLSEQEQNVRLQEAEAVIMLLENFDGE